MYPFIIVLTLFLMLAAFVAIEAKGLLSTVVSVGAAGLALAVIFMLLGAPDLAITQVVVEVLCLVLLIRAAVMREDSTFGTPQSSFVLAAGLIGGGIFLTLVYFALQTLTPFGTPLMNLSEGYLQNGLTQTGAVNYVMAILLDYRAYDTLGEATVIFASIIGVYAVMRRLGRKKS